MQPQVQVAESVVHEAPAAPVGTLTPLPVLAELLCSEPCLSEDLDTEVTAVQSYFDPVLLHHPNVLIQLKALEAQALKPCDYFQANSKQEILPYMRKVVASWMLEVCEEQSCEDSVFPLSVALLDRFLGCTKIKAEQLQLVGCVCLLLASKTRQESHFSLQLLSWYTENSVSLQTLMNWELMILSQLNWDVNILTPTDFVDFLLVRTPDQPSQTLRDTQLLRRHAITFIALCSTEPRFVGVSPSLIAASAIYTALKGIRRENSQLANSLANMAEVSCETLISTATSIEQVISTELAAIEQTMDRPLAKNSMSASVPVTGQGKLASCGPGHSTSSTPTDIQEIFC